MSDIEKNTDMDNEDARRARRRQLLKTGAIAAPLMLTLSQGASAKKRGGGNKPHFSVDCSKNYKGSPIIPSNYRDINKAIEKGETPPTPANPSSNERFNSRYDGHWYYVRTNLESEPIYSCAVSLNMPDNFDLPPGY